MVTEIISVGTNSNINFGKITILALALLAKPIFHNIRHPGKKKEEGCIKLTFLYRKIYTAFVSENRALFFHFQSGNEITQIPNDVHCEVSKSEVLSGGDPPTKRVDR